MRLLTLLAALAYVFAVLYAEGWLVVHDLPRAVALIAAGLLCSLVSGTAPAMLRPPPTPPSS